LAARPSAVSFDSSGFASPIGFTSSRPFGTPCEASASRIRLPRSRASFSLSSCEPRLSVCTSIVTLRLDSFIRSASCASRDAALSLSSFLPGSNSSAAGTR
jgi:hypothetical protein